MPYPWLQNMSKNTNRCCCLLILLCLVLCKSSTTTANCSPTLLHLIASQSPVLNFLRTNLPPCPPPPFHHCPTLSSLLLKPSPSRECSCVTGNTLGAACKTPVVSESGAWIYISLISAYAMLFSNRTSSQSCVCHGSSVLLSLLLPPEIPQLII